MVIQYKILFQLDDYQFKSADLKRCIRTKRLEKFTEDCEVLAGLGPGDPGQAGPDQRCRQEGGGGGGPSGEDMVSLILQMLILLFFCVRL